MLTFPVNALAPAVSAAAGLCKTSTIPVAANLLIEPQDGCAKITSTRLDITREDYVECAGESEAFTIPCAKLAQILATLSRTDEVSLEYKGGTCNVLHNGNKWELVTLPVDDFPRQSDPEFEQRFTVSGADLKAAIAATEYALPTKDHRRVLMCLHFNASRKRIEATDGKRLAVHPLKIDGNARSFLIDSEVVRMLARSKAETVEFFQSDRLIKVDIGEDSEIKFAPVEGKYPDIDQVVPKDFTRTVTFDRGAMLAAVQKAAIMADDRNHALVLKIDGDTCALSAACADVGTYAGKCAVVCDGEALEIAYNANFLAETLSLCPDKVTLKLNNETAPSMFCRDSGYMVLMPIKLADVAAAQTDKQEAA